MGPRGAGKTTAMLELAKNIDSVFYMSLDVLAPSTDLFQLIQDVHTTYRPKVLLLDDVHFFPNINQTLKNIYDFLDVQLYFSSSIALAMLQSRIDLARRATIIDVHYFYFLEATQKKLGAEIHAMPISHIFQGN